VKKLWIVPPGVGAEALSWVVLASIPDIKLGMQRWWELRILGDTVIGVQDDLQGRALLVSMLPIAGARRPGTGRTPARGGSSSAIAIGPPWDHARLR
jgi:hypothetical protein